MNNGKGAETRAFSAPTLNKAILEPKSKKSKRRKSLKGGKLNYARIN